jgi:hypothetical protein
VPTQQQDPKKHNGEKNKKFGPFIFLPVFPVWCCHSITISPHPVFPTLSSNPSIHFNRAMPSPQQFLAVHVQTLGSVIRTFAFGILLAKIVANKSVNGISLKMIELYIIVFGCRLSSILFYEGYLPFDSSGDYLYRGMEIAGCVLCILIAIFTVTMYKDTYQSDSDSFGKWCSCFARF